MKFANKLELRYVFNDKSNYMDAMIRHRCEKEVLALLSSQEYGEYAAANARLMTQISLLSEAEQLTLKNVL